MSTSFKKSSSVVHHNNSNRYPAASSGGGGAGPATTAPHNKRGGGGGYTAHYNGHHNNNAHHRHHQCTTNASSSSSSSSSLSKKDIAMLMLIMAAETVVSCATRQLPSSLMALGAATTSHGIGSNGMLHPSAATASDPHTSASQNSSSSTSAAGTIPPAPLMMATESLAVALKVDHHRNLSVDAAAAPTMSVHSLLIPHKHMDVTGGATTPNAAARRKKNATPPSSMVSESGVSMSRCGDEEEEEETASTNTVPSSAPSTPIPAASVSPNPSACNAVVSPANWYLGGGSVVAAGNKHRHNHKSFPAVPSQGALSDSSAATNEHEDDGITNDSSMSLSAASSASAFAAFLQLQSNFAAFQSILSFLGWREIVNIRGVSKLFMLASLNFASICRMPMSGTPAVFIPYNHAAASTPAALAPPPSSSTTATTTQRQHQQQQVSEGGAMMSERGGGGDADSLGDSPLPSVNHGTKMKMNNNTFVNNNNNAITTELLQWNSQTTPWRCPQCQTINNFARVSCSWHACGATHPAQWNNQRLFLGQLRRDGTVPFVLWLLCDVMGISKKEIKSIENHRDKATGRGKGCAWVTVSPPSPPTVPWRSVASSSDSADVLSLLFKNTNADKLLSLHHRAFFDTVHGVEGVWLTSDRFAEGLDGESALRSNLNNAAAPHQQQGTATATVAVTSSSVAPMQQHSAIPTFHPRHMPRSSVVVESTNPPQQGGNSSSNGGNGNNGSRDMIGRKKKNLPFHYVLEVARVQKQTDTAVEDREEKSYNIVAESKKSFDLVPTGRIRMVHNPYFAMPAAPAPSAATTQTSLPASQTNESPSMTIAAGFGASGVFPRKNTASCFYQNKNVGAHQQQIRKATNSASLADAPVTSSSVTSGATTRHSAAPPSPIIA